MHSSRCRSRLMRAGQTALLAALVSAGPSYAQVPAPAQPPTAEQLKERIEDARAEVAKTRERIEQWSKESGVPADRFKAFDTFIKTDLNTATPDERKRARDAYRIWEELVSLKSQETALRSFEQQLEQTDDILAEIEDSRGVPDRAPRTYTPMAEPWSDVTPALGAMGIVNRLLDNGAPLSSDEVKMIGDFIRMYGEAYGLPTDSTTLALQSAAANTFPSDDPSTQERNRRVSILHGIVTLFESRSGTKVAGEGQSSAQPGSGLDWGTLQPGATYRKSIPVSNGCANAKLVAISHDVPHLSAPLSISLAPGGSVIDLSIVVPAGARGTISGTITFTYPGDETCKPRTASYPVTARIQAPD